jgi:antitoxin Phd
LKEEEMARFTLTELGNKSGEVVEAAFSGPVEITSRGKRKFVLMTAAQFDRLKVSQNQRAFSAENLTVEESREILSGLDTVALEFSHSDA